MVLGNLLPYWILQPFVDAAFKKRGIDPEDFWRSAGLPAFRWPDPNGTRFPNGAPPPAPPVLEGTPDHPGPAVAPGSPCSYTPPPEMLPRPGNPMPCAGLDQGQGPFGPNRPRTRRCPTCLVAAEPERSAARHRVSRSPGGPACRPGPARHAGAAAAEAPPGARTEPLGPAGPTPPPSTFAPGLPPGPAAPPGPGAQLPAPFISPAEREERRDGR